MTYPKYILVSVMIAVSTVRCSVLMREEECRSNGNSGYGCSTTDTQDSGASDTGLEGGGGRQISRLEVELPKFSQQTISQFTPLPYAAFLQPRPVYQESELKVFNVLEKERAIHRQLKGGKRHPITTEREDEVNENGLTEDENVSRSEVRYRRRKGGKRSDRKKQLRKERIERKRERRRMRRKLKKERRRQRNHPKYKKNNKRNKVNKKKLKSLRGNRRNQNRNEDNEKRLLGTASELHQPESKSAQLLEANSNPQKETFVATNTVSDGGGKQLLSPGSLTLPSEMTNSDDPDVEIDDYNNEDDFTDIDEYGLQTLDDYPMSPEYYFNWKDNSTIDYFSQVEEDLTTTPESWPSKDGAEPTFDPDPNNLTVRRHVMRLHNLLRSRVDPPAANMLAMSWHGAAAQQARQWAESCVAHRGRDHPSVRWTPRYGACGQNVLVTRRKKRWANVIRTWWSERRHFTFGSVDERNTTYKSRSYTQMVWYSSHKLGCGYARCSTSSGRAFYRYVCNYCPAGNDPMHLSEPYTRGRACEMCPRACRSVCPEGQCRLCTNRCPFSNLWANCETLAERWRHWLCSTRTPAGVERFKNCRATCQCGASGDKIF